MSAEREVWRRVVAASEMDGPHGWLQWKGTNACIDLHCACGVHGHIDGDSLYFVRCKGCGATYAISGHVMLVPLTAEEEKAAEEDRPIPTFEDQEVP